MLMVAIALATLAGCGGGGTVSPVVTGNSPSGTPAGNYSVTITANGGNFSHSEVLNLIVQ